MDFYWLSEKQLYDAWVSGVNSTNWNNYNCDKRVFDSLKKKQRFYYYDKVFKESPKDLKKT